MTRNQPPVLLMGGQEGTLSVLRSLTKKGLHVRVSAETGSVAFRSRFCKERYPYALRSQVTDLWDEILLAKPRPELAGTVLFACCDDAVTYLATRADQLGDRYVFDRWGIESKLGMLDKLRTLELAKATGCPTPLWWRIAKTSDLEAVRDEIVYPCIVKPVHSHLFTRKFKTKFLFANDFSELAKGVQVFFENEFEFIVSELIPGPDNLLSSYYSYIDENGRSLFHFTKKIVRRYPKNKGGGSYHLTDHMPETEEAGRKFFAGVDLRGFGNVEFKRDTRDGKLKIIECNTRFTDAQDVIYRSGLDMAHIIYCHLTGQPLPEVTGYEANVSLWYPERDYHAFKELRRLGELSTWDWLKDLSRARGVPYFSARDPWPGVWRGIESAKERLAARGGARRFLRLGLSK